MKERLKKILVFCLLLIPVIAYAETDFWDRLIVLPGVLLMEAFVSIHMSLFVLMPIAKAVNPMDYKKTFWKLFAIRAAILIICDLIIPVIAFFDFIAVFIGAMIVVPIVEHVYNKNTSKTITIGSAASRATVLSTPTPQSGVSGIELKCAKCGGVLQLTDKFCGKCGAPFDGNNVIVTEKSGSIVAPPPKQVVTPNSFGPMYILPERQLVETFIEKELEKAGIASASKVIPSDALRRKNILNVIFAVLVFVYISLIFFHFPLFTYIIGLIILIVFFIVKNRFNFMKYLVKQVQSRPGEKISNIIMSTKNNLVNNNSKLISFVLIVVAVIAPLIIFYKPRIIYEKVDGGYAVRYYIYGATEFGEATIPEEHNGEKVISLRGNTFSNMPLLEKVVLPNTILEIRGQAFQNCVRLRKVNIPSHLEYLGGGAFYNTKELDTIELPNSLTYLGGEAFYGSGISHITLSENLTEIRGNTFENCIHLQSIVIPDNVTRIGGHAFYGDTMLSSVKIGPNSKLDEIGSSAFRRCNSFYSITIPKNTDVNSRAFKESPTNVQRYGETLYNY